MSHVAVVGGGFSGTLQAINLLRNDTLRVTLIERRARAGEGLAYGDAAPGHLLNVRAKGMSAFPDRPDDFVLWLARHHPRFGADSFVPRLIYGEYLRDLLGQAGQAAPERLTVVQGEAVGLVSDRGVAIMLADGREIAADRAILAIGNLPPNHPRGFGDHLAADLYAADPWTAGATAGLDDGDTVLILGTGLTMVDLALRLVDEGFGGKIVALSRRGLVPHSHGAQEAFQAIDDLPAQRPSSLLRAVRRRAAEVGWRNAVDELRRFTQPLWRDATPAARVRFLKHLRPWWDIHRHRLAPEIGERIGNLMASGRLSVIAAGTLRAEPVANGLRVAFKRRGQRSEEFITVRRAINCTGPQSNLAASTDPLLRRLSDEGSIRPDELAIGIDVDERWRTIAADGTPNERLYAVGPMTRGAVWEIVAVPDIRQQVWALAEQFAGL